MLRAGNWAAADWLEGRGLLAFSRQALLELQLLRERTYPANLHIEPLQWLAGLKGDKVQWTPQLRSALAEVLDECKSQRYSALGHVRWLTELVGAMTEAQAGGAVAGGSLAAQS